MVILGYAYFFLRFKPRRRRFELFYGTTVTYRKSFTNEITNPLVNRRKLFLYTM